MRYCLELLIPQKTGKKRYKRVRIRRIISSERYIYILKKTVSSSLVDIRQYGYRIFF